MRYVIHVLCNSFVKRPTVHLQQRWKNKTKMNCVLRNILTTFQSICILQQLTPNYNHDIHKLNNNLNF